MAKIVYAGIPAHGHTNPMLPVLKELVQRGHTVRCYNPDDTADALAIAICHAYTAPMLRQVAEQS